MLIRMELSSERRISGARLLLKNNLTRPNRPITFLNVGALSEAKWSAYQFFAPQRRKTDRCQKDTSSDPPKNRRVGTIRRRVQPLPQVRIRSRRPIESRH